MTKLLYSLLFLAFTAVATAQPCPSSELVVANGFSQGDSLTYCEDGNSSTYISSSTTGPSQRTYQWYLDGQPIPSATLAYYQYNFGLSSAGIYTYRVSSTCDTAFSSGFELIILPRPTVSITASGNILTATTLGTTYDWYYNNSLLPVTTQSITEVGTGTYTVFVTAANGCQSPRSAPFNYTSSGCNNTISIFGGALNGALCESANRTLHMQPTVNAGTNLTYQWFKDNVLIPGATALRYEFQALVANNGTYSIVVASNCDTVTYGNLVVDITPRPAAPIITASGSTLNSNVAATSYFWYLDGVLLADNTQSITATTDGAYRVIITANGCASDTSAAYNYIANADCGFATIYTIGSGNCPIVTFELDGATAPITTSTTFGTLTTPLVQAHASTSFTMDDFCAETYVVILADANGCLDTVTFTVTEVGITEVNNNIALSIYPNPTQQTLALQSSETVTGVAIYNIMGQQVLAMDGNITTLDVTTLPAGTYYINVNTIKGAVRKPFVKL